MPVSLPAEIIAALERGATVVTANARAARALLRAFAEHMRTRGERSWRAPAVQSWEAWLSAQYERAAAAHALPTPLTLLQELALWQRVQQEDARRVVTPFELARLTAEAYALAREHRAELEPSWFDEIHTDAEHFLQWTRAFERECARLQCTSRATCAAAVARYGWASQRDELLLLGFDRLSPAQAAVMQRLEQAGGRWALYRPGEETGTPSAAPRLVAAKDARQELEACALWVREQLARDPALRLGVLTPQLAGMRAAIDRVFRRVLQPESAQRIAGGVAPYEFSLGVPLAAMPNVAAALMLLRWLASPLPAAEVSALLLGDFMAADVEEAAQLAAVDEALRRRAQMRAQMPLAVFLRAAGGLLPEGVRQRLSHAQEWLRTQRRQTRGWPEWADTVAGTLERCGWPGFRERGSVLYQAEEAWTQLLGEMAGLGAVSSRATWDEVLHTLTQASQNRMFAAETLDAPVQVVGIAEAAGQQFDAVWVLGMTEDRWPGRGRLHPLLPPALQRAHGMPHAHLEDDRLLAETQMHRVAASAGHATWSYARVEAGVEQRPSPMLHMVWVLPDAAPAALLPAAAASAVVHIAESQHGPAWTDTRVAGGSEVLKHQAACAFQGFARARLGVRSVEEESRGLDTRERATLLHRAMEQLWSTAPQPEGSLRLHTLGDLLHAIEHDRLQACVAAAAAHAVQGALPQAEGDSWEARFLELEQRRLERRMLAWLDQEQKRADFAVDALEHTVDEASLGAVRLRLRLDRADTLSDGTTMLLDYKTSDGVSVRQWSGPRPDEPQLPIYALHGGYAHVSAVAFAQVRAGKNCLHAVAEEPAAQLGDDFAKRDPLTEELREEWRTALRGLADAFARGEAQLDPKKGSQTCRLCGLHALCRIRSQPNQQPQIDEEDADV